LTPPASRLEFKANPKWRWLIVYLWVSISDP